MADDCHRRRFEPTKKKQLLKEDRKTIEALNALGHESISLCICDPDLDDCPIVFASDGFCNFTGYEHSEIEGKSCRFLQGPGTSQADVDVIRDAIKYEIDSYVGILNYRKDGTPFRNHFFISPIHDKHGTLLYFIGVQCFPEKLGSQRDEAAPENMGWGYSSSRIAAATRLAADTRVPATIVGSAIDIVESFPTDFLQPGDRAETYGMPVSELNGQKCTIVCYMESTGRYLLELDSTSQTLSLRHINLRPNSKPQDGTPVSSSDTKTIYSVETDETKSSSTHTSAIDSPTCPLKTVYSVEAIDQMRNPPPSSGTPEMLLLQEQNTALMQRLQILQGSSFRSRILDDRPDPPGPRIDAA